MSILEGATRIIRSDAHNVAVERYVKITPKAKDGEPTPEPRYEWQEVGYYGHRLDFAANSALFQAMPIGEPITADMIRKAVDDIVARTQEAVS